MSKLSSLLKTAFRVTGKKVLHRPRAAEVAQLNSDWQTILDQIRETGMAIVPDFWTSAQCKSAIIEFDAALSAPGSSIWSDNTASDQRIFGFEKRSESGIAFLADEQIRAVKGWYYQADPDQLEEFVMMNKVICQPGNLGSGGGWHRDAVHEQQLKAIMYLTDVTEKTGAFQYLYNTHQKSSIYRTIQDNDIGYAQSRFTENEIADILNKHGEDYPLETVTGKAGTLILADTSGIHRGSPIEEGNRYAITQYLFRSPAIGGKGIPEHIRKRINT